MANVPIKSITFPGLEDTYTFLQDDPTLSVSGAAADAKITGDKVAFRSSFLHPNFRPDDFVQITDIAAYPDGWWDEFGHHGPNTYTRTEIIPVYPGKTYYVPNKPNNPTQAIFLDENQNFVSYLNKNSVEKINYTLPNGYTQSATNYLGTSSATSTNGIFKFTVPAGCYYISYNINAANLWSFTICTKPIFALNTFWLFNRTLAARVMARDTTITPQDWAARVSGWNNIIPVFDTAYQQYGKRKLCVIGPSTVMIDRRNPSKNGLTQFIVGYQEYIMPYYGEIGSYGYSGASWGDSFVSEEGRSIHTMICGNETLEIDPVDLSGYDDFVLHGSTNGISTTGVGDWDSDTPDTDTYLGGLRATIDYIFSQNSSARVWVLTMPVSGASSSIASDIATINAELKEMCDGLGVNFIDFNHIGINKWTRVWAEGGEKGWTYDGTHYNHYGSYMIGQALRHILVGR